MTTSAGLYFAQITDIHVGNNTINGEAAKRNLTVALAEIADLPHTPRCILATADLVCSGRRDELEEFVELAAASKLPIHALPANHDLWGQEADEAWQDLIGPVQQSIDLDDLRLVLFQDVQRKSGGGWHATVTPGQMAWLAEQLSGRPEGRTAVAFHAPILEEAGDYHDNWRESNAPEFLDLLRRHRVLSMITGHWHRVNEWCVGGVPLINTGALVGWQWTGIPPYHAFPVRAGYALFYYHEGRLRWFWRELVHMERRPATQVNLVTVGPVHTGGPRPQVRPPEVFTRVTLRAQSCLPDGGVEGVEWSLAAGTWQPMACTFDGIWQDWEAELDPRVFRAGEHVLAVRAVVDGRPAAYDAVPVRLAEGSSPPLVSAQAGRESVFELFYVPK